MMSENTIRYTILTNYNQHNSHMIMQQANCGAGKNHNWTQNYSRSIYN